MKTKVSKLVVAHPERLDFTPYSVGMEYAPEKDARELGRFLFCNVMSETLNAFLNDIADRMGIAEMAVGRTFTDALYEMMMEEEGDE